MLATFTILLSCSFFSERGRLWFCQGCYKVINNSLVWKFVLGVAAQDVTFKRRYELLFVALACVAGDALYQELHKQEELVKLVSSLAEQVKDAKDKDVSRFCQCSR